MAGGAKEISSKSQTILDAAERLFTLFGYRRTAMDDVACEAGVAKGTLYLYFDSKAALFRAILTRNVALAERLCDAAEVRGGSLAEQIFGQLEAWFGMMLDRYGASDHLSELSATRVSVGSDIAEAADRAYEARLVRMIETAQAQGEASLTAANLDAAQAVSTLLAAARGAKYIGKKAVTPENYRESLWHIAQLFAAAIRNG
ncbi:MAG: helix-turn-helix domain-containing protein [Nostoc sp.]|uniref:TetR/AcrR family transcriptional regulator n=1 Tax=Nostoc sp. TaxID=1180 RepID=UPI002FF89835